MADEFLLIGQLMLPQVHVLVERCVVYGVSAAIRVELKQKSSRGANGDGLGAPIAHVLNIQHIDNVYTYRHVCSLFFSGSQQAIRGKSEATLEGGKYAKEACLPSRQQPYKHRPIVKPTSFLVPARK